MSGLLTSRVVDVQGALPGPVDDRQPLPDFSVSLQPTAPVPRILRTIDPSHRVETIVGYPNDAEKASRTASSHPRRHMMGPSASARKMTAPPEGL